VPKPLFVDSHGLLPEATRVWAVGPAESGKSIYAANEAADLTREGLEVAYFSEENPISEDVRRLGRLRPDFDRLRFYHGQAIDLGDPTCVAELLRETFACSIVIFDTLSACWSGDENDNAAIGELDREALVPFTRQGATVVVLDHSGHPVPFTRRKGVHAARGASAKGQKADVVLEFVAQGPGVFRIEPGKMRVGGHCPPPVTCTVVDTDDDGLSIEFAENAGDPAIADVADELVAAIGDAGELSTKALKLAVRRRGETVLEAMAVLRNEDPSRVEVREKEPVRVEGKDGKVRTVRATVWRLAGASLLDGEDS
jgi:hypothetical protein